MCQTSIDQTASASTLPATKDRKRPLFQLGQVVATPAVLAHLEAHAVNPLHYLWRHQCGDWGSVPEEDARENDFSVSNGFRILSRYEIAREPVWIITEADRSVTTLLFPSEY